MPVTSTTTSTIEYGDSLTTNVTVATSGDGKTIKHIQTDDQTFVAVGGTALIVGAVLSGLTFAATAYYAYYRKYEQEKQKVPKMVIYTLIVSFVLMITFSIGAENKTSWGWLSFVSIFGLYGASIAFMLLFSKDKQSLAEQLTTQAVDNANIDKFAGSITQAYIPE